MHPSSPSDLIWEALTPLVQQLEALGQVLEICAFYLPWCGISVAGLALLLLTGLVLVELNGEASAPPASFTEEGENTETAKRDDVPARPSPSPPHPANGQFRQPTQ